MAIKKKDGRKTKQFALRASVNASNQWDSMTAEQKQARIDSMQAGRRKKQIEKEQAQFTEEIDKLINETITKARPLDIAKTNMTPVPPTHETPDLDLGDIKMPDVGALAAFNQVTTHRRARRLVTGIKEAALKEDSFEITADNEYVGISWLKLQSLVYKIMKEMDDE